MHLSNNFSKHIKEEYLLTSTLEKTNEAYALAKIIGLKSCEFYNKQYKTNYLTLMPCNFCMAQTTILIQKKVIYSFIKNLLIQKIVKKKNLLKFGVQDCLKREIMHVDLADAISFIIYKKLENNKSLINLIKKNSLINVGSGQELTIKNFAKLINLLTKSKKKLKFNKKIS